MKAKDKVYVVVCDWCDDFIDASDSGMIIEGVYANAEDAHQAISNLANEALDAARKSSLNPKVSDNEEGWLITIEWDGGDERTYRSIEMEVE